MLHRMAECILKTIQLQIGIMTHDHSQSFAPKNALSLTVENIVQVHYIKLKANTDGLVVW